MPTNEQRRQAAKRKLDRQLARRAQRAKRRRLYAVAGSAAAVVLVVGLVVLISALTGDDEPGVDTAAAQPSAAAPPSAADPNAAEPPAVEIPTERAAPPMRPQPLPASVDCQFPVGVEEPAKPVSPPAGGPADTAGTVDVTLQTNTGAIPLTLDRALAPCAVKSFVNLTEQGYFDNTPCHRLTTGPGLQVLQCGDPTGAGTGGPGYSFADEIFPELTYGRSYLAMANSGPNTNGSQFFIVYGDAQLPPSYTVFGTVSDEGLEVVDAVAREGSVGGAPDGPPAVPVQIETATVQGG